LVEAGIRMFVAGQLSFVRLTLQAYRRSGDCPTKYLASSNLKVRTERLAHTSPKNAVALPSFARLVRYRVMANDGDCALGSATPIASLHRFGRKRRDDLRDSRRWRYSWGVKRAEESCPTRERRNRVARPISQGAGLTCTRTIGMKVAVFPSRKLKHKVLRMTDSKCWNCGEDCFEATSPGENSTVVQVHYVIEKKQVCRDCYQILRELEYWG
jgi:hypothetical protein